ncbi:unnamed protein product [Sphagnum balticum]
MQQCPSAASAGTVATAIAAATTTTGKLQVMAATHSTLSLRIIMLLRHKKRQRVVVGVFLPEEQCVKKKEDLLPLAASFSPSKSRSSICDSREQSSCSSQGSEFGGDLPVNEVAWPELAHQYLVFLIHLKKVAIPVD